MQMTVAFGTFLAGCFVGNFMLGPIPALWPILFVAAICCGQQISRRELLTIILICVVFLPGTLLNFAKDEYFFSVVNAALWLYILILFRGIYGNLYRLEPLLFIGILLILAFFYAIPVEHEGSKIRIFGPNIQYRIYAMLYLIYLVAFSHARHTGFRVSVWKLAIVFLAMAWAMLATGSRAALIITGISAMITVGYLTQSVGRIRTGLIGLIASVIAYQLMASLRERFFRSFILDFQEDNSANIRFHMFDLAKDFWSQSLGDLLFGMGPDNGIFPFYPHNIGLELLVYWGLPVLLIFTAVAATALTRAGTDKVARDWLVIFLPLLIGIWASGDLSDNYSAVTILTFIALKLHCRQHPRRYLERYATLNTRKRSKRGKGIIAST